MGCFLTLTTKDFEQLNAKMRQAVSIVPGSNSGSVRIQVSQTAYASAKEMAEQIRRYAPNTSVISVNEKEAQRTVPTEERYRYVTMVYATIAPALVRPYYLAVNKSHQRASGVLSGPAGDAGQEIAANILEQTKEYSINYIAPPHTRGPDIMANSSTVIIEVKTSKSEASFGSLLGQGYGHRQCSDGWLEHFDLKPSDIKVLGVHINPVTETVIIYKRLDENAKHWEPVMKYSLSEFNIGV
jgi:hypothetical protein